MKTRSALPIVFSLLVASLVALGLAAQDTIQKPVKPVDPQIAKDAKALMMGGAKISQARKTAFASTLDKRSSQGTTKVERGDGRSLFTNAPATDKDAIVGYFVASRARVGALGFGILQPATIAKQIGLISLAFEGTNLAALVDATIVKLNAGGFDAKQMQADLDKIQGTVEYAYGQKGAASAYHFGMGDKVGFITILGLLLDEPAQKADATRLIGAVQKTVVEAVSSAPSDVDAEMKTTATAFATAKMADPAEVNAAINAINGNYAKGLN